MFDSFFGPVENSTLAPTAISDIVNAAVSDVAAAATGVANAVTSAVAGSAVGSAVLGVGLKTGGAQDTQNFRCAGYFERPP